MIVEIVEKARKVIEKGDLNNRRGSHIHLAKEVWALLRELIEREGLITETGGRYPIAWLIEDIILWVLSDEKRLEQFLNDNYEEVIPESITAW